MNTINDFKARAEFFPAGRIIPQRILKGPRKIKCRVRFGGNSWALPTECGYVIACDAGESGSAISIHRVSNCALFAAPYTPRGGVFWVGNARQTDQQWGELVWREVRRHNSAKEGA